MFRGRIDVHHNDCEKSKFVEENKEVEIFVYPDPSIITSGTFGGVLFFKFPKGETEEKIREKIIAHFEKTNFLCSELKLINSLESPYICCRFLWLLRIGQREKHLMAKSFYQAIYLNLDLIFWKSWDDLGYVGFDGCEQNIEISQLVANGKPIERIFAQFKSKDCLKECIKRIRKVKDENNKISYEIIYPKNNNYEDETVYLSNCPHPLRNVLYSWKMLREDYPKWLKNTNVKIQFRQNIEEKMKKWEEIIEKGDVEEIKTELKTLGISYIDMIKIVSIFRG